MDVVHCVGRWGGGRGEERWERDSEGRGLELVAKGVVFDVVHCAGKYGLSRAGVSGGGQFQV